MPQISLSKIVFPVDFSPRAEESVLLAHRMAAHFGAELMLLHVVEPFHVDFAMVEPFEDTLRELAQINRSQKKAQLNEFGLPRLAGVTVTSAICEGEPAEQILQCSKTHAADLIVMPTQGH